MHDAPPLPVPVPAPLQCLVHYGPPRHKLIGGRHTAAMISVITYGVQVVLNIVVVYYIILHILVGVRGGLYLLTFLSG